MSNGIDRADLTAGGSTWAGMNGGVITLVALGVAAAAVVVDGTAVVVEVEVGSSVAADEEGAECKG